MVENSKMLFQLVLQRHILDWQFWSVFDVKLASAYRGQLYHLGWHFRGECLESFYDDIYLDFGAKGLQISRIS
jgi:hypothetical protein